MYCILFLKAFDSVLLQSDFVSAERSLKSLNYFFAWLIIWVNANISEFTLGRPYYQFSVNKNWYLIWPMFLIFNQTLTFVYRVSAYIFLRQSRESCTQTVANLRRRSREFSQSGTDFFDCSDTAAVHHSTHKPPATEHRDTKTFRQCCWSVNDRLKTATCYQITADFKWKKLLSHTFLCFLCFVRPSSRTTS